MAAAGLTGPAGVLVQVCAGGAVGLLAGTVFFGGLAATVRRLPHTARPVCLVLVSLGVRLAILAGALAVLAVLGPAAIVAGAVSLVGLRTWLVGRQRTAAVVDPRHPVGEGGSRWT